MKSHIDGEVKWVWFLTSIAIGFIVISMMETGT